MNFFDRAVNKTSQKIGNEGLATSNFNIKIKGFNKPIPKGTFKNINVLTPGSEANKRARENKTGVFSPINTQQKIQTAGFGLSDGQFIIGAILVAAGISFVFNSKNIMT